MPPRQVVTPRPATKVTEADQSRDERGRFSGSGGALTPLASTLKKSGDAIAKSTSGGEISRHSYPTQPAAASPRVSVADQLSKAGINAAGISGAPTPAAHAHTRECFTESGRCEFNKAVESLKEKGMA